MTGSDLILVTGATENTGAAILDLLKSRHAHVRALVRRKGPPTEAADTIVGDFDDPGSTTSALQGVSRAYLVTPSSPHAEAQQIRFAELAAAAGVRHIVKLSQFAAAEDSPVRFLRYHAAVERRIRALGIAYTFLRPNLYFQGLFAFQPMIAKDGRFMAPIGNARVSAVDVRDIAAVAVEALTGAKHEGQTYTITGPAAVTHPEMASAIDAAIGRPVTFLDVPAQAFAAALGSAGVPQWQIDGLIEDYAHYARGEAATVLPTVRDITGKDPREFSTFARDHAAVFGASTT